MVPTVPTGPTVPTVPTVPKVHVVPISGVARHIACASGDRPLTRQRRDGAGKSSQYLPICECSRIFGVLHKLVYDAGVAAIRSPVRQPLSDMVRRPTNAARLAFALIFTISARQISPNTVSLTADGMV